jgi:hypothetical protein
VVVYQLHIKLKGLLIGVEVLCKSLIDFGTRKVVFLIPLQAWTGPEGSRRLRLPDFKTICT